MSMLPSESFKKTVFVFDPNATSETEIGWVDMKEFDALAVDFIRTVGTSALTLKIQGAPESDGTGAVDVVTKTFTAQPDAKGDYAFIEAVTNDFLKAGTDLRYASAVASFATATDEGLVVYEQCDPKHYKAGLNADIIA